VRFKPVRKAVFPVAGLGTRFLPATKAMPKEMLPVVDKPLIQYAVEEAAAAGIEQMIFVTGRNKRAIEDHFDRAPELEQQLAGGSKQALLEALMSATPRGVSFVYVRQPEPLGLGHAVLCALPVVNDEPFAVILADDLIDAQPGVTAQLVQTYERYGASAIAVQDVPRAETGKYGIVATESLPDGQAGEERVRAIVEKPQPEDAPSTLAVVGRYVRPHRARPRRRNPAHRRDRPPRGPRRSHRTPLRGRALRLRLEGGFPRGQRRDGAQAGAARRLARMFRQGRGICADVHASQIAREGRSRCP